MKVRPESVL